MYNRYQITHSSTIVLLYGLPTLPWKHASSFGRGCALDSQSALACCTAQDDAQMPKEPISWLYLVTPVYTEIDPVLPHRLPYTIRCAVYEPRTSGSSARYRSKAVEAIGSNLYKQAGQRRTASRELMHSSKPKDQDPILHVLIVLDTTYCCFAHGNFV